MLECPYLYVAPFANAKAKVKPRFGVVVSLLGNYDGEVFASKIYFHKGGG